MNCPNCTDAWTWVAFYDNGEQLAECPDPSLPHHAWKDVDKERLREIVWIPLSPDLRPIALDCTDKTTEPELFRLRIKVMSLETGGVSSLTAHALGLKKHDATIYTFVMDDGTTLISSDLNAVTNRVAG